MMEKEEYKWKVCVRCFTYNHAPYITDAMNGFTMQQTDFPFVCCIVDDASSDGEQEIIKKYLSDNFEISEDSGTYLREQNYGTLIFARHNTNINCYFAVLLLKNNHYGSTELKLKKREYISEWENSCKYEALCEGDDYWINPNKLQKQVDFLESNPKYSMCASNVYNLIEGISEQSKWNAKRNRTLTVNEIILNGGLFLATCSLVFRSSLYFKIPEKTKTLHVGDYPLQIYMASIGKVWQVAENLCVYRIASSGSWTEKQYKNKFNFCSMKNRLEKEQNLLNVMDEVTEYKYHNSFKNRNILYTFDSYFLFQSKDCIKIFLTSPLTILKNKSIGYILFSFLPQKLKQMYYKNQLLKKI